MTETEEFNEACDLAARMAGEGATAKEVVSKLNAEFEAAFYESGGVVYMRREPDYLPSRTVAKFA